MLVFVDDLLYFKLLGMLFGVMLKHVGHVIGTSNPSCFA